MHLLRRQRVADLQIFTVVEGRNKPVHGRFRQKYPCKCGLLRRKRPLGRAYSGLHLSFNGSVRNISKLLGLPSLVAGFRHPCRNDGLIVQPFGLK